MPGAARRGAEKAPVGCSTERAVPSFQRLAALLPSSPSSYGLRHKVRNEALPGATFPRRRESGGGSEPGQDAGVTFGVNTSTCRQDLVCGGLAAS